jgi:DNA-binding MarR family transcriptional regulator
MSIHDVIICETDHRSARGSDGQRFRGYDEAVDQSPPLRDDLGNAPSCVGALAGDLGWGLGVVLRAYAKAAYTAVADLPGGPRGYQILSAAAQGAVSSQLALAQHLGVDRTVMTYLLDDLEAAKLIERRPDPNDRRARRVVATQLGTELLATLNDRLRAAEAHLLAPLDLETRATFRAQVRLLAIRAEALDPLDSTHGRGQEVSTELPSAHPLSAVPILENTDG